MLRLKVIVYGLVLLILVVLNIKRKSLNNTGRNNSYMNKTIPFFILLILYSCKQESFPEKTKFLGQISGTMFLYTFYENNDFTTSVNGHAGVYTVKGSYRLQDSIILLYHEKEVNPDGLIDQTKLWYNKEQGYVRNNYNMYFNYYEETNED